MVYALVYVEHADLIADFDSYDEAKATLDAFVADHPDARNLGRGIRHPLLAVCEI